MLGSISAILFLPLLNTFLYWPRILMNRLSSSPGRSLSWGLWVFRCLDSSNWGGLYLCQCSLLHLQRKGWSQRRGWGGWGLVAELTYRNRNQWMTTAVVKHVGKSLTCWIPAVINFVVISLAFCFPWCLLFLLVIKWKMLLGQTYFWIMCFFYLTI